ncbi:MAG: 2,3-bisphosphoglycerate-independent phosphoglycerate mutase [Candidatus Aenigmarchaeota archaeon]|nr:2,3-bisphosphoglycerate-independent phosphoglycerate mutase [Candidatus Aenigmarchaeota archaeon]
MGKKTVFIVVDGMADLPIGKEERTPLTEAKKPNIDWFAKNGATGQLTVIPDKMWNDLASASISHKAAISLLGYNVAKFDVKRGPLEAVGADIPYQDGHLALRCNFATVDKNMVVTDRRAGRSTKGLAELARYINEHVDIGAPFNFMRTYGHRAVLVVKMGLTDKIVTNDPLVTGRPVQKISGPGAEGVVSSKILQNFADKTHQLIEYHPINSERMAAGVPAANYILLREPGNGIKRLTPEFGKRFGVKAMCICELGAVRGACLMAGFDAVTVPEMPFEDTLDFIFENADVALEDHDFVFIHIKGPIDEASHDGDFEAKRRAIEKIDERMARFKKFDGIVVMTTDHITSTERKSHMPGKVPLMVWGRAKDATAKFDEATAKRGKLKNCSPFQLMKFVFGKK